MHYNTCFYERLSEQHPPFAKQLTKCNALLEKEVDEQQINKITEPFPIKKKRKISYYYKTLQQKLMKHYGQNCGSLTSGFKRKSNLLFSLTAAASFPFQTNLVSFETSKSRSLFNTFSNSL